MSPWRAKNKLLMPHSVRVSPMVGPLGVSMYQDKCCPTRATAQALKQTVQWPWPRSIHKAGAIRQPNTKNKPIAGTAKLPPGKASLQFVFDYDGGGPGKGGKGALLVNGQKVAEGRIEHTQAGLFSADETADVGIDLGTPVVEAIGAEARSRFTGRIPKLTVEVK